MSENLPTAPTVPDSPRDLARNAARETNRGIMDRAIRAHWQQHNADRQLPPATPRMMMEHDIMAICQQVFEFGFNAGVIAQVECQHLPMEAVATPTAQKAEPTK
jgi:hypothetical protein